MGVLLKVKDDWNEEFDQVSNFLYQNPRIYVPSNPQTLHRSIYLRLLQDGVYDVGKFQESFDLHVNDVDKVKQFPNLFSLSILNLKHDAPFIVTRLNEQL